MKHFFLFQRNPEPGWPTGKKIAFWVWNIGFVLLSAVGLALVSLLLAVGPYTIRMAQGYLECPLILVLNIVPVVGLALLLYGLAGRAWLSYLLTAVVLLGLSLGNYYKLAFRDDPLMFADLFLLKEAGNMAGRYTLFLDRHLVPALVCGVAGFLFLLFLVRGRPPLPRRLVVTAAGAAVLAGVFPTLLSASTYADTAYFVYLENRWSATQKYIARGFIYPFLHSISSAFETPPEGYDEKEAAALLAQYEDADIPEDKKVNVIGIMLEAYNDFSRFDIPELNPDVYALWHQLEDEGWSGNLVTNIFAGGTVDTERCFLTGYSRLNNFRSLTNSYAWYFRTQGYTADGMHPCFQWFYNRQNINAYLGFEDYYYVENYFGVMTGNTIAPDYIFLPELLAHYQELESEDKPCFSFSVSYQGHGPYSTDTYVWNAPGSYVLDSGRFTDEALCIMENYFGSIANTNYYLEELIDYLRADTEPVVLVLFGDHNPWLGDGNSVYTALGLNFDLDTQDGFLNYYSTRYIIWANDAAKTVLGSNFQGEGPDISPCFLMNELFRLCGWAGPAYMQATDEVMALVPVFNTPTGLYMEDGVVTADLSPAAQELADRFEAIQYYQRSHFLYGGLT